MNYWFDMDGVLVKYDRSGYIGEQPMYLRKGVHYFRDLQPDKKAMTVLKALSEKSEHKIYILTTVTNIGALYKEHVLDKIDWLHRHCPFINTETQFVPAISSKRDVIESLRKPNAKMITRDDILIDDFNKNLNEWTIAGGLAVKYLNGLNSPNKGNPVYTYAGLNLTEDMTADEIIDVLTMLKQIKI